MNHYPRHIGDYLRDTSHLSLLEHGVYGRLLDLYYLNNGPLRLTAEDLVRKLGARSAEEREAVERVLSEFFAFCNGTYSHKRADRELEKYKTFSEQQRQRVQKRWSKDSAGIPSVSKNVPSVSKSVPPVLSGIPARGNTSAREYQPITNNQEPITNSIPPSPPSGGKGSVDWFADLPAELDLPEFRAKWLEWVKYRKSIKKPINPASAPAVWRKAVAAGAQAAIDGFETAMANGWQGSFPVQNKTKTNHRDAKRSNEYPEQIDIEIESV